MRSRIGKFSKFGEYFSVEIVWKLDGEFLKKRICKSRRSVESRGRIFGNCGRIFKVEGKNVEKWIFGF